MVYSFPSDNLIYNRFDVIHKSKYKEYIVEDSRGSKYVLQLHYKEDVVYINNWGKEFPQDVFEQFVNKIFEDYSFIKKIEVHAGGNDYKNQLSVGGDVVINLDGKRGELWNSLSKKVRYNLRRSARQLSADGGELSVIHESGEIDEKYIKKYFEWKKQTHERDYGLTPREYVAKYYVTDIMLLMSGKEAVSMVLYNRNKNTVYLENISYNQHFQTYSPGILVYAAFLEEMEKQGVSYVFLGNAGLDYKKRFGAVENKRFYGNIYRQEVFDRINQFLLDNKINSIAIYGLGLMGRRFMGYKRNLNTILLYGVDRYVESFEDLKIYRPDELEIVPKADFMILTIGSKDKSVEELMTKQKYNYIYLEELMEKIGCEN